ncbi:MAG: HD domain-containing protein [Eubacterium sp.]|nr:HD domain-containing protein [Eubacterium sp.]
MISEQLKKIKKELKKELDKNRYQHTLGVMYTASCLAMRHGGDMQEAMYAGLLHDCAKCIPIDKQIHLCEKNHIPIRDVERKNPHLLHAKLGVFLAKSEYGIKDKTILHAIEVHTTGAPNMGLLDKILFVADYIEPHRDRAPNLTEVRTLAFTDINEAVLRILYDTIYYLNQRKGSIDSITYDTYQFYKKLLDR